MADQTVRIKIAADASELPRLRRDLLSTFKDTSSAVDAARQRLQEAQTAAQELGRAVASSSAPSKALQNHFDAARTAVRGANAEVLSQVRALQAVRAALENNAAAQAAAQQAESRAAAAAKAVAQTRANRAAALARAEEQARTAVQAEVGLWQRLRAAVAGTAQVDAARTSSHRRIREGVDSISASLGRLQTLYAGVLGAQGLFLSASGLTRRIDDYASLEARLKLASASSREFALAQEAVLRIAQATGQPLAETGQLYTRLANAVRGMGRSQEDTVAITESVALALKLTGATSAEAGSAMLQLSQAFASGALRGEEFNAVNEAAPRLMQALADSLGVSTGALRQLAQDGKLTGEVLATALTGALGQLRAEAAGLPDTVGQAMQGLSNEFTRYIAQVDKANGYSVDLVKGIRFLTENLDDFVKGGLSLAAGGAAIGFVKMAKGIREAGAALTVLRAGLAVLGGPVGLLIGAATGLGAAWLLSGDKAKEAAEKAKTAAEEQADAARKAAQERADEIKELNARIEATVKTRAGVVMELEKKQAEAAKKAGKEAVDAQIADQKRLIDAIRSAQQAALAESAKLTEQARQLREQATGKRTDREAQAEAKRIGTLPEDQQQARFAQQARGAVQEADVLSARATLAALSGDTKKADDLAQQALAAAEKAAQSADRLTDQNFGANLLEQIGAIEEAAVQTQAKVAEAKAAEEQARADQLGQSLTTAQASLDALIAKAAEFKIDPDITAAQAKIATLDQQIDALKAKAASVALGGGDGGAAPEGFATGGLIRGPGSGTSDSILARLSNGEYVMRAAAVRHYGTDLLGALNRMRLPRFADGGLVSRLAIPRLSAAGGRSQTPVNLNINGAGPFPMQASPDVIGQIQNVFAREALKRGRR